MAALSRQEAQDAMERYVPRSDAVPFIAGGGVDRVAEPGRHRGGAGCVRGVVLGFCGGLGVSEHVGQGGVAGVARASLCLACGSGCGHRVEDRVLGVVGRARSEEHTSELQSLMRISYAVFCLKKKKNRKK